MNSNVIFYFSQTKNYKILTGQKASEKKTLIFNSPTQKVKSYLEPLSTLLVLCTKQLKWKNFFYWIILLDILIQAHACPREFTANHSSYQHF